MTRLEGTGGKAGLAPKDPSEVVYFKARVAKQLMSAIYHTETDPVQRKSHLPWTPTESYVRCLRTVVEQGKTHLSDLSAWKGPRKFEFVTSTLNAFQETSYATWSQAHRDLVMDMVKVVGLVQKHRDAGSGGLTQEQYQKIDTYLHDLDPELKAARGKVDPGASGG